MNTPNAFETAMHLHRQGRLLDAERMYETQLRSVPGHFGALHNLGVLRAQQGRMDEAEALIRKAIKKNPKSAEAHNALGNILHRTKNYAEANTAFGRALALKPDYAQAYNNRGATLQALGRTDQAVSCYEKAISILPNYADAHHNLANALRELGRKPEAVGHFQKALAQPARTPATHRDYGNLLQDLDRCDEAVDQYLAALAIAAGDAELYYNLATALLKIRRHQEALANYQRAVELKPGYGEAHNNLGALLLELGRPDEAVPHFDRALALEPSNPEAHCNRGQALLTLKRVQDAADAFANALAIRPDHAVAHNNLGTALRELGRYEEAIQHFETALKIHPGYATAYANLTDMRKMSGEADAPGQDRASDSAGAVTEIELSRVAAELADLGRTAAELGRSEEAQHALEKAVDLEPRRAGYYLALSALKRFTPGDRHLLAMQALFEDQENLPAEERMYLHFALGKALADAKDYERSFWHQLQGNALKRRQITYDEAGSLTKIELIRRLFTPEFIRSMSGVGDPSPVPVFIVGMPRSGTSLIEQILASHPQVFGAGELDVLGRLIVAGTSHSFTREWLQTLGPRYLAGLKALAPPSDRISDKMPSNFLFVGLIHLAMPNARIIHARRDPVDTCLSCFSKLFDGEQQFAYDLGELGRYYRAYDRLMAHWREVLPEGSMLEVDYEEVVGDLEVQARGIISYCGLEWNEACLEFHKTERAVRTASIMQVRQPIYRSSVGRGRPYAHLLTPLLEGLEIETEAPTG